MSAPLETNTAAGGVLDSLYGTASKGFDLWSKWTAAKTDNLTKKVELPSTVAQPTVTSGADTKKLALYGGGILAAVLVLVLLLRGRGSK